MGGSVCKTTAKVMADPDVLMYASVRDTALLDAYGDKLISGSINGMLYVKGNQLCYQAVIVKGRWKKCVQRRWDLSQVTHMTVLRNQKVRVWCHRQPNFVSMNPGLKVSLLSRSGHSQSLVTSMSDVEQFSTRLAQHINSVLR